jgi:hypothetical protein
MRSFGVYATTARPRILAPLPTTASKGCPRNPELPSGDLKVRSLMTELVERIDPARGGARKPLVGVMVPLIVLFGAAVAENAIGDPFRPVELAAAFWVPGSLPKVHDAEACPSDPVCAVAVANVPPPALTANVTETPATPAPEAAVTLTTRGWGSACPAGPVWWSPAATAMAVGVEGLVALEPPQ